MLAVLKSFNQFSSWRSILIFFFMAPVISVLSNYFIYLTFGSYPSDRTLKTIIISLASIQAMSSIGSSLVLDSHYMIKNHVLAKHKFSLFYWSTKLIINVCSVSIIAIISLLIQSLIYNSFNSLHIFIGYFFLLSIYMSIFGCFLTILVWEKINPYFLLNIFGAYIFILSCSFVPLSSYPYSIRYFVYLIPLGNTINSMFDLSWWLIYDLVYCILITIIMVIILKYRRYK